MKAGRKSKWASHVQPRLTTIKVWKMNGVKESEICKNLGVGHNAFNGYKQRYGELREVLKTGRDDAIAAVVDALYKRAVGYDYEEERTVGTKAKGKALVIGRIEKIKKQVAPDVIAQIFYLKNRASQDWHDRREHELSGPGGMPLQAPIIHKTPLAYIPDNGRKRDEALIAENIKNGRNGRNGHNKRF